MTGLEKERQRDILTDICDTHTALKLHNAGERHRQTRRKRDGDIRRRTDPEKERQRDTMTVISVTYTYSLNGERHRQTRRKRGRETQ